jgi:cell division protein FtsB
MRWVNRVLLAIMLAAAIAFVPHQLELANADDDLERVLEERARLAQANREIEAEMRLLHAEIRALKSDRAEVARIAREDLNLVGPDEIVFEIEHAKD